MPRTKTPQPATELGALAPTWMTGEQSAPSETISPEAFEDLSIEQGIREFFNTAGTKYRAERDSVGPIWKFFRKEGNASVFICTLRAPRNASARTLFSAYLNQIDRDGIDEDIPY
jgi:hypothetical protein